MSDFMLAYNCRTTDDSTPALTVLNRRIIFPLVVLVYFLGFIHQVHAQGGALDPTFGISGKTTLKLGASSDTVDGAAFQIDGKIVVAGGVLFNSTYDARSSVVARFNSNGSLDQSFGDNGNVLFQIGDEAELRSVAVQTDEKIVVAGDARPGGGRRNIYVLRFNPDGSFDESFGTQGRLEFKFGSNCDARDMQLQPDGKIVVAGYISPSKGIEDFLLLRLNIDGTPDMGFGTEGRVVTDFGAGNEQVSGLALPTGGKIVVAGQSNLDVNTPRGAIAQYNSDGTLDNSFDGDGKVIVSLGRDARLNDVAVQNNGKIIIAVGVFGASSFVMRYNPDGTQDSSFGNAGRQNIACGELAVQPDDGIICDSSRFPVLRATRLNPDGAVDSGFGTNGTVEPQFDNTDASISSFLGAIIVSNGRFTILGSVGTLSGGSDVAIAQYYNSGSLDTSFDVDGKTTIDFGLGASQANAIAVQADGKIITAGSGFSGALGKNRFLLSRLNPNGSLDNTFGDAGTIIARFPPPCSNCPAPSPAAVAIGIQPDGKIVVAGANFELLRFNPDGSADNAFGDAGKVAPRFTENNVSLVAEASSLILQSDGKAVIGGTISTSGSQYDFAVARFNANGSLDTAFGTNGLVRTDFVGKTDVAEALAITTDGKIVAAGYAFTDTRADFAAARYNADGTLDTTFSGDGKATAGFAGRTDVAYAVSIQAEGKILLGGYASNGVDTDFALFRLTSDGSPDTAFGSNGSVIAPISLNGDIAYSMVTLPNGNIVLGGLSYAQSSSGDSSFALARFNPKGVLDSTFGSGGRIFTDFADGTDVAFSLALQPGGKLIAAGYATVGGKRQIALARYANVDEPRKVRTSGFGRFSRRGR